MTAYIYTADIVAIHDGDTITASLSLGFDVYTIQHLRLLGCNARELSQPGGKEALANLAAILSGKTVTVRSVKPDKYARYDAAITLPDGTDLVTQLIADGWAAEWNGQGPKPVPPWPRTV
jgi:endonuclease YncB( thermonuclease family)